MRGLGLLLAAALGARCSSAVRPTRRPPLTDSEDLGRDPAALRDAARPLLENGSQVEPSNGAELRGFEAFVINLDTQPERLEGLLEAVGKRQPWMLHFLRRVPGVDGRQLLANETRREELLARGFITPENLRRAEAHTAGADSWGDLSPGAVGLYVAHSGAWQEIVDRGLRYGLVMEDDLRFFGDSFQDKLKEVLRGESLADISYFQHCLDSSDWPPGAERAESSRPSQARPIGPGEKVPCLASYMLSQRGARRLLEGAFPMSQQLDMAISDATVWRGLHRIVFEPALAQVGPTSYVSNVQANTLCQRWGWKIVSFLGMWSRHFFYPLCAI